MHFLFPQELDRLLQAEIVAAGEDGNPWGVGHTVAVGVVQADAVVVDLVYDCVVGGPAQISGHLLGDGEQAVTDNFDCYGINH